jgi:hypothetical protein
VLTNEGMSFFRQLTAGSAGSEIMLRKANGETWRASHQLRPIAQACHHTKIEPPVSFHALRHTWASNAVMNGGRCSLWRRTWVTSTRAWSKSTKGHLAPSYIADTMRAGASKCGFKPNPKIATLAKKGSP